MKKSLLALAVLGAFAGAAQAQSSVEIYGSVDAGLRSSDDGTDRKLGMNSAGTYNSNRIGFRGTEDLGGGLKARFLLESRFATGTGSLGQGAEPAANNPVPTGDRPTGSTQLFNGNSYVGLGGDWGWVDMGRQYTPQFDVIGTYDPFNYKYTGILAPVQQNGGLTRFNNSIKYRGNFGPVGVIVAHGLGEQAGNTGGGAATSIGGTFGTGPFNVGAAYTTRANVADTADQKNWTVGGAFKTGPMRIAAGYINDQRDAGYPTATGDREQKTAWVGGSFAVTPAFELAAGYFKWDVETTTGGVTSEAGSANQAMFGGTYALSKRTNFYAEYDFAKPKGGDRLNNFSVGLNHLF